MSYHGTLGRIDAPTMAQNNAANAARALIVAQVGTTQAAFLPLATAITPKKQLNPMPGPVAAFWSKMTGKPVSTILERKVTFADGTQIPTPGATNKAGWVNGDVTWDTWLEADGSRILRVRGYNPVTLPMMVAQAANAWLAESVKGGAKAVADTVNIVTKAAGKAAEPVVNMMTSGSRMVQETIMPGSTKPSTSTKPKPAQSSTKPSMPSMVYDDAVITAAAEQATSSSWWKWLAGASVIGVVGYVVARRRKRGS